MPAPKLRSEFVSSVATGTWSGAVMAVPAGRAVAVSKLLVLISDTAIASCKISVALGGPTLAESPLLAWQVPLALGEVYTETGLVIPAGHQAFLRLDGAGVNQAILRVFGQEVDN